MVGTPFARRVVRPRRSTCRQTLSSIWIGWQWICPGSFRAIRSARRPPGRPVFKRSFDDTNGRRPSAVQVSWHGRTRSTPFAAGDSVLTNTPSTPLPSGRVVLPTPCTLCAPRSGDVYERAGEAVAFNPVRLLVGPPTARRRVQGERPATLRPRLVPAPLTSDHTSAPRAGSDDQPRVCRPTRMSARCRTSSTSSGRRTARCCPYSSTNAVSSHRRSHGRGP